MPRYAVRPPLRSSAETGGVQSVDRALMVLSAFRKGDGALTLAELAARAGLVKSTTLRVLASLQNFGLIARQEDGTYSLGLEIARLNEVFTASFSIERVVLPVMRDLSRKTGESVAFHVRQGDRRLCLYRVESQHPLREHGNAGDLLPLDRGSGGRVLLAFSGAAGPVYDTIRKEGVAVMTADRVPDLAGISAPVFGQGGKPVGAITLIVPLTRFDPSCAVQVRKAAIEITRRLGDNWTEAVAKTGQMS